MCAHTWITNYVPGWLNRFIQFSRAGSVPWPLHDNRTNNSKQLITQNIYIFPLLECLYTNNEKKLKCNRNANEAKKTNTHMQKKWNDVLECACLVYSLYGDSHNHQVLRYLGFGFTTLPERVTTGAGAAGTWLDFCGWLGVEGAPSVSAQR